MIELNNIATVLSGFSTVIIAVLTIFLWRENRLLRKAGSQPQLVAYFEPHPDGTGGLNIAIANVGTGPAKNIYFQFIAEPMVFSKYEIIFDGTSRKGPFTLIPQGEKISFLFAVGHQLFKSKEPNIGEPLPPFIAKLQWTNLNETKPKYAEFILDVKPYGNLPGLINKPYLLKISESIDTLGEGISTLRSDVSTIANLIEANSLESARVKKIKGNREQN